MKLYTLYIITNKINGKVYIGQTYKTTEKRAGNNGLSYKSSPLFYNAIQKYGWYNFYTVELCSAINKANSDCLERYYIKTYDSTNPEKGYNIAPGGSSFFLGRKHSEETKKKMSRPAWNKGKPMSDEQKKKLSIATKGKKRKPFSDEHRQALSLANTGKVFTEEHIQNLCISHIGQIPSRLAVESGVKKTKGKTWKVINGKRIWLDK